MDLPFHLRALPPEALDVLRFFGGLEESVAHATHIMNEVGLSERAFGKVVRRLVTKGYLQMGGDQIYRLTDFGASSVQELAAYEDEVPPVAASAVPMVAERQIFRRLVLVTPRALVAGMPAEVQVGFNRAAGDFPPPVEIVVRLSLVNGEPARPQEKAYNLSSAAAYQTFEVTPGRFTQVRLRLQVYQLGPNPDDIAVAGGMYLDVPVVARAAAADSDLAAYGADILITA